MKKFQETKKIEKPLFPDKTDEKKNRKKLCLEYTKKRVIRHLPIIEWIPKYKWKEDFLFDFLAGLTLACICVPQGLAFAILANVDLIYGINTCCVPAFLYGIFGTAINSSMGAAAMTSLLFGESVILHDYETEPFSKSEYVATLTLTIGIYYLIFFSFRLHYYAVVFKSPFVTGFLTVCAIPIILKSIILILGLEVDVHSGILSIIYNGLTLFKNIEYTNIPTLIFSSIVLILFGVNYFIFAPLLRKVTMVVFPMETFVMCVSILVSYLVGFSRFGIPLVGLVPTGVPKLTLPSWSAFKACWLNALTLALVNYVMTISNLVWLNDHIDSEQEILAMAIGNILCSFIECFAIGNSIMRSMVAWTIGLKSLLAQIISAILLFQVTLFAGALFAPLPKAVLGCIMLIAASKLFYLRILEIKKFYKSYEDLFIYVVTFLTTFITTVEIGVIVGLVFTLRKILHAVTNMEEEEEEKTAKKRGRDTYVSLFSDVLPEDVVSMRSRKDTITPRKSTLGKKTTEIDSAEDKDNLDDKQSTPKISN